MSSTPGVVNYPTSLDDVISLIQAANNAATALTSSVGRETENCTVLNSAAVRFPANYDMVDN